MPRRNPIILIGVTVFGVTSVAYTIHERRRASAQGAIVIEQQGTINRQNETINEQNAIIQEQQTTIREQQNTIDKLLPIRENTSSGSPSLNDTVKPVSENTSSGNSSLNDTVKPVSENTSSGSPSLETPNKPVSENSVFSDINSFLNKYFEFLANLEMEQLILIFNSLCSALLLSILVSVLLGKYGNYLIEKFNLKNNYPKLTKFLLFREKMQNYYFVYSITLAFLTLGLNLFINLSVLFT